MVKEYDKIKVDGKEGEVVAIIYNEKKNRNLILYSTGKNLTAFYEGDKDFEVVENEN